jgi:chemotaxis protein MotB
MAAANKAPIVIKKVKKVSGHGHHGGAWKVAYADFVTAMMAFFLLMWLINTTSPEQKRGIADFFAPASVAETTSGAGGLLAGQALAESGARQSKQTSNKGADANGGSQGAESPDNGTAEASESAMAQARAARENAEFERAEQSIRQAIQDMPDLAELSKHVLMEVTPDGLRIQLVDQEGRSMFEPGGSALNARAKRLLSTVAGVVAELPNRISIAGHTDGTPPGRPGVTNWDLSSDRANAARRVLQAAGVEQDRVYQVSGKADAEPLFPDDPSLPGNRRISVTLLREAPVLPPGAQP